MPEPSDFCAQYTQSEHCYGAPCARCRGAFGPHLYADVAARQHRQRQRRRLHPHVAKRPEAERVPREVLARASDPRFGYLFRRVRLVCPAADCTGYMVVRGRGDRRYRFAGCSLYRETGCRETLGSWAFVERKAAAIEDLLASRPPSHPVIFVTPKPRAPKNAA